MTFLLCVLYFCIGSLLIHTRIEDIAMSVPNPGSLASIIETVVKWIGTWPLWVFKKNA